MSSNIYWQIFCINGITNWVFFSAIEEDIVTQIHIQENLIPFEVLPEEMVSGENNVKSSYKMLIFFCFLIYFCKISINN